MGGGHRRCDVRVSAIVGFHDPNGHAMNLTPDVLHAIAVDRRAAAHERASFWRLARSRQSPTPGRVPGHRDWQGVPRVALG
jgi:hypothetical protein